MSTGVGCTLWIDGTKVADGSVDDPAGAVTALSGLQVTFGRDTSVDQPAASSCSFSLLDEPGGSRFVDLLRTGRYVEVKASGTIYVDPDTSTITDPGFDTTPVGETPANVTSTTGTATVQTPGGGYTDWETVRTNWLVNPALTENRANWGLGSTTTTTTTTIDGWTYLDASTVQSTGASILYNAPYVPTEAGDTVAGAFTEVTVPDGYPAVTVLARMRAYADVYIDGDGDVVTIQPGETVRLDTGTVTIPEGGATGARLIFSTVTGGVPAGARIGIRRAIAERNTTVGPYFDGDTTPADPDHEQYVWQDDGTSIMQTREGAPGDPALRVDPKDASKKQQVTIAPAAFSQSPAEWDIIPKLVAGQTWQLSVDVTAFDGAEITLQAVGYPDPTGSGVILIGNPVGAFGTGEPVTLTTTVTTKDVSDVWVGVRVTVFPSGPTWQQAPPVAWQAAEGTWLDQSAFYIDNVTALAPAGGVTREVLVYAGRITDITASWDDGPGGAIIDTTTADFTADLDNIRVGDEPWTAEPMGDRFNRILTLTGTGVTAVIDPALQTPVVSWQDVDAQPATGLLQDLAQSVDGVMWSAVHSTTGPYLHVEDPSTRPSLYQLALDDTTQLVVIVPASDVPEGLTLSACDVLRDPVEWVQNVSDVSTRVAVTWAEQGVDDDGQPTTTDRTVTLIDATLEAEHGQRSISVSTQLTTETDAQDVAQRVLDRASITGWRVSGVTIDDAAMESEGADATNLMLQLLDGTLRNGIAITITDLPAWSPLGESVPGYLEGGTYTFEDGRWVLELTISRAVIAGTSVAWVELPADPAWAWTQFDPEIAWSDLYGVAAPEEVPA